MLEGIRASVKPLVQYQIPTLPEKKKKKLVSRAARETKIFESLSILQVLPICTHQVV